MRYLYLKMAVKRFVTPVFDLFGVYDARLRRSEQHEPLWTIVMYHRVIADGANDDPFVLGMCVGQARFAEHIAYLRSEFELRQVGDVMQHINRGEPLPRRTMSVTFDDGYLDNLTHALPVLESYQVPATLFVATDGLGDGTPFWWDRAIAAVSATNATALDLRGLGLSEPVPEKLSLQRLHRGDSMERLLSLLWTLPHDRLLDTVDGIERQLLPADVTGQVARRLSPQNVREMHRRGVEIGAHSARHPNLTLMSHTQVLREMTTSKQYLENLCGAPVRGFAYPGGRVGEAEMAVAEEAGFDYAVATGAGVNRAPYRRYGLKRVGAPISPVSDFKRCLSAYALRR